MVRYVRIRCAVYTQHCTYCAMSLSTLRATMEKRKRGSLPLRGPHCILVGSRGALLRAKSHCSSFLELCLGSWRDVQCTHPCSNSHTSVRRTWRHARPRVGHGTTGGANPIGNRHRLRALIKSPALAHTEAQPGVGSTRWLALSGSVAYAVPRCSKARRRPIMCHARGRGRGRMP